MDRNKMHERGTGIYGELEQIRDVPSGILVRKYGHILIYMISVRVGRLEYAL
jgi:hypothetical protein